MKTNAVISFENVTKDYDLSRLKYGLLADFLSDIISTILKKPKHSINNKFVALNNVSFTVSAGETLGIIGRNGAGKSTILKLVSKITYPDAGKITAVGRIGAFIELGAGLHYELTGRENIYLYGAILGMKRKEIKAKFDDIVNFAGIRKFLDLPIKKYSSGMYSRLGFSVCAFCDPEILLVDEVLAVGDASFQAKCLAKMKQFRVDGKTIVFVSHNLDAIASISSKVMYLDHGKIIKIGKPKEVIKTYLKSVKDKS